MAFSCRAKRPLTLVRVIAIVIAWLVLTGCGVMDPVGFFGSEEEPTVAPVAEIQERVANAVVPTRAAASEQRSPVTPAAERGEKVSADVTSARGAGVGEAGAAGSGGLGASKDPLPQESTVVIPTKTPEVSIVASDNPCLGSGALPAAEHHSELARDCQTLLRLRDELAGSAELDWSADRSIWRWQGVKVGGTPPRVVGIDLTDTGLRGILPADLGALEGLQELKLFGNDLSGEIPAELGNLTRLVYLRLGQNNLIGRLPATLGNLTALRLLGLGNNDFEGALLPEIGGMTELQHLWLDNNRMEGEIPPELDGLNNLVEINLLGNAFFGCLPVRFRDEVHVIAQSLWYCDENPPVWSERPTHEGGVDLAISHIERLPRYLSYKVTYWGDNAACGYPFEEDLGPVLCPYLEDVDRWWPDQGERVELVAHVFNLGDRESGQFVYRWRMEGTLVEEGVHEGLASGGEGEVRLEMAWPSQDSNPWLTLEVALVSGEEEIIGFNNRVVDWIKGYPMGFSFSPDTYDNLRFPKSPGPAVYSPEYWLHAHIEELNRLLAEAGLEDRVRIELFWLSDDHHIQSKLPVRKYLDGWWAFLGDKPRFRDRFGQELEINYGLIHELLHQMGVIDLYTMFGGLDFTEVPDANRPGKLAGCGTDYWRNEWDCFYFAEGINDIMGSGGPLVGLHTAGGLAGNYGHRRGHYGEYLFDTPTRSFLKIVDKNGRPQMGVDIRFYQFEVSERGQFTDKIPEFEVTTGDGGLVLLPNRGVTGPVTLTGHQLRPNPFGIISVVGINGIFLLEMDGGCINYEWLTVVDLNLSYWSGEVDDAVLTRTLVCPPP